MAETDRPPIPAKRRPTAGPMTELRLVARRVHFLAGIVVAPFVLVLCVTGLIYVFSPQIHDNLYHRQLYANAPISTPRPVSEQVQAALTAHPEGTVREVITPPEPGRTTRVVLSVPDLTGPEEGRTVFVDPFTNFINGELTTLGDRLPANVWLRELHSNLRLGEPGRVYAELAASWLPVITVGGLVLWLAQPRRRNRPSWRELLLPVGARGAREPWWRLRAWHGPLGVWLTLGVLALSVSGLVMSEHAGGRADQRTDPVSMGAPSIAALPATGSPPRPQLPGALPVPPPPPLEVPAAPPAAAPPRTTEPDPSGGKSWEPSVPGEGASSPETPPSDPGKPPPHEQPAPPEPEPSPVPPPQPAPEPPPPSEPLLPLIPGLPLPDLSDLLPGVVPEIPGLPLPASSEPALTTQSAATGTDAEAVAADIGVDRALEIAAAQGLRGELIVRPPHASGGYAVVERSPGLPLQRDSLVIEAATGRVVEKTGWEDYSFGAKFSAVAVEFHTGTLFGLANQIVLAVLAVGLFALVALGYRMWWVHNPYRGRWASLPPPVWRQLSRPWLVLVLLAVVVLTWALPVLGASLVLFVLVDGAINTLRRRRATAVGGE
ncbi:PepSY domain-containing protein [Saccharopolyspora sp. ID03-671]|uniref:PepSY-associated TM helix domain-containing protein n=1 Tax=Saccharopolyspora sp. ID03-671 TaxID=3073066 RepID=UPI0032555A5B